MSRFGQTEKFIFSIAIILLMGFAYFLYDDSFLFPKTSVSQLELIGNVAVSQNDVRRENLDTFSWVPASRKDKFIKMIPSLPEIALRRLLLCKTERKLRSNPIL